LICDYYDNNGFKIKNQGLPPARPIHMMKQAVKGFQGFAHGQKVQERGMGNKGQIMLSFLISPLMGDPNVPFHEISGRLLILDPDAE